MSNTRTPSAAIRTYARALNDRDVAALHDLVAPGVIGHERTAEIVGLDAFKASIETWLATYPDMQVITNDLFDSADRAAWRWTLRGTHAPTQRAVAVSGIIVFRLADGRIAEYWGHYTSARGSGP